MVTAFLDANVLYPSELRNLLMHMAVAGAYRARWSAEVHEEWIEALLKQRPDLTREQLDRTRRLMDLHAEDCLVTAFADLIETLDLPDPDDRHVLAAAIRGGADVIVTLNLHDFPAANLSAYSLKAVHPDAFVVSLFRRHPEQVATAMARHRQSLRNPPISKEEYVRMLIARGLKETAALLTNLIV